VGLQDRDYMQEDEANRRLSPEAQRSGNVDKMLQKLDLSNLPPSPPKPALRRALDWIRRLLGIRPRRA
jgi:hypothetical protein